MVPIRLECGTLCGIQLFRTTLGRISHRLLILDKPEATLVWRVLLYTFPIPEQLTYEIRKVLHMLFVPFIVAICFHTKALSVVGAILLVWYLVDRLYFTTRM